MDATRPEPQVPDARRRLPPPQVERLYLARPRPRLLRLRRLRRDFYSTRGAEFGGRGAKDAETLDVRVGVEEVVRHAPVARVAVLRPREPVTRCASLFCSSPSRLRTDGNGGAAISQRDTTFYDFLQDEQVKANLAAQITDFWTREIRDKAPVSSCAFPSPPRPSLRSFRSLSPEARLG